MYICNVNWNSLFYVIRMVIHILLYMVHAENLKFWVKYIYALPSIRPEKVTAYHTRNR